MAKKMDFGQFLVEQEIISAQQLTEVQTKQKEKRENFNDTLLSLNVISENVMLQAFAKYLGIPFIDLTYFQINLEVTKKLSEPYARHFQAIVLEERPDGLLIGMVDPMDIPAIDELKRVLGQPIRLALVKERDLINTLDLVYRHTEEIIDFAEKLDEELSEGRIDLEALTGARTRVDTTVIKLLQSLFVDAVQTNASDIHIEPEEKVLRIRIRIDGILHEQIVKEKAIAPAMSLRLKLMAGLNITEKRLPQEGRFNVKVRDRAIDVRLSILPTQYGESVTMRLLDQSTNLLSLEEIGMSSELLKRFYTLLQLPYGIILVTGPTGCGKTTTLYGVLSHLNVPEKKIITVEDPVEYRLPRINQSQVKPQLGLTFASISKVILRNDPDIIMVGEMRDEETASIAIRASLTGHLVLSTLHTNDAAGSVLRLLDMKIPGYLVASTLRGVLAQRLVRRVCESCKTQYEPSAAELSWLEAHKRNLRDVKFAHGKGCAYCNKTGYKGRIGIFELLELDKVMMNNLSQEEPTQFMSNAMKQLKGKLLVDSGLDLVKQQVTTLNEVIRVAGEF
jgi:MSHA biogenesis protein MshE